MVHKIEKQTLNRLIFHTGLRYSQLKPEDVESNHFMYYLKRLITRGYVSKINNRFYDLTNKGRLYTDRLSLKTWKLRVQPKIDTLIICKNRKQEYLLYRRNRQPFFNMVGFPYGKVHLGESITESAHREFKEKTGMDTKLTHRGEAYIIVHEKGELVTHLLFHVFAASVPDGKLNAQCSIGECFWSKITAIPECELIPGVVEIHKLMQEDKKCPFWAEYKIEFSYPPHLAEPTPARPSRKAASQ